MGAIFQLLQKYNRTVLYSKDAKPSSAFLNQDQASPFQSSTTFQRLPISVSTVTYLAFNLLKTDLPNNFRTIRPDYENPGRDEEEKKTNYTWVTGLRAGFELLSSFLLLTLAPPIVNSHWLTHIPQGSFYCQSCISSSQFIALLLLPPSQLIQCGFASAALDSIPCMIRLPLPSTGVPVQLQSFVASSRFFSFFHSLKSFSWENFLNKSLSRETSC